MYSNTQTTMLNKFAVVILILLISFGAKGSVKNGVITGRVYEKGKSTPLQYATITIQNKEKKILGGTISGDDGNFTIDMIATGECYVKVSFIGYRDTAFIVNLKENENRISLGEIGLSVNPSLLKSATISSKVPLIEQKIDKIIFNAFICIIHSLISSSERISKVCAIFSLAAN